MAPATGLCSHPKSWALPWLFSHPALPFHPFATRFPKSQQRLAWHYQYRGQPGQGPGATYGPRGFIHIKYDVKRGKKNTPTFYEL